MDIACHYYSRIFIIPFYYLQKKLFFIIFIIIIIRSFVSIHRIIVMIFSVS